MCMFVTSSKNPFRCEISAIYVFHNMNVISSFVKETRYLTDNNIIVKGIGNNGVFVNFPLKFKMLTLKIEF